MYHPFERVAVPAVSLCNGEIDFKKLKLCIGLIIFSWDSRYQGGAFAFDAVDWEPRWLS